MERKQTITFLTPELCHPASSGLMKARPENITVNFDRVCIYIYIYMYVRVCFCVFYINQGFIVSYSIKYKHFKCYHCHSSTAPSYVTGMLHRKPLHTRNTRSSSYTMPLLNRPAHSKATLGDRSFSFASSSVWNSIPNDVRCAPSLSSFKSRLKTYLFRSVYKD